MKNFVLGVLTTLTMVALLSFQNDENDYPKKEWIIESKYLHLQDGISKEEAREWIEKNYLPLYREIPGLNVIFGEHTGSALWGGEWAIDPSKGDLVMFYIFDSKYTKDLYFPQGGPMHELVQNALKKHPVTKDFWGKYVDQDKYLMTEYKIFTSAK